MATGDPPTSDSCALGVDIGGTTTRAAVVADDGAILARLSFSTPRDTDAPSFTNRLCDAVTRLLAECRLESHAHLPVGLALPGTLDEARTRVTRSVNLPFLEGAPLASLMYARLDVTPVLTTDADAATWAEYHARTDKPTAFAHLRLGTGVACGVVHNGRLLRLDLGRTRHLDALRIDDSDAAILCPCGLRGCLETIASGPAILRRAAAAGVTVQNRHHPEPRASTRANLIGKVGGDHDQNRDREGADACTEFEHTQSVNLLGTLNQKCRESDPAAMAILNDVAFAVRRAAERLHETYGVSVISVGGGVCATLPILVRILCLSPAPADAPPNATALTLNPAALGDEAGAIGAARLAMEAAGPPSGPPA